jgi:hypothetical protein
MVIEHAAPLRERTLNPEDLGEDVLVLAVIAAERGHASMVRKLNGLTFRVTVEAA